MADPRQSTPPGSATGPELREPYERPAIAWEEPLDVRPGLMAGCLKLPTQGDPCDTTSSS